MKITALEEYGLRCLLQLARSQSEGPVTIARISKEEGLSLKYVAKILWRLRKSGLIRSVRGASGGYKLVKDPDDIRLSDILAALGDGFLDKELCSHYKGSLSSCTHLGGCGIRPVWFTLANFVNQVAQKTTLGQLMGDEFKVRGEIERLIKESAEKMELFPWESLVKRDKI